ncbi:T9SS type A sorting domain-containing protein [Flavobacterium sp. SM2513]|uniref:Ig-like domain-containing protein n=1 Tax=Flavobacterium sp. SM2513 TaxID=3424766 RepID=UPI003D7FA445
MKTTYIKKVVFMLFLLFNTLIYGQYYGGDADGFSLGTVTNATCSNPTQFYAYFGGNGSLSTFNSLTNTTCGAPSQSFAYRGGDGDGFTSETLNTTTCGNPAQFYAYFGGDADGGSSETLNTTVCASPNQFYAYFGGNADGASAGFTASACPTDPPVADFTASATNVCIGETVTFTDTSTNLPAAWTWTFTGGTPNSSTVQNPEIVYNTPGSYAVTLIATNFNGSDTETKSAFIIVNALPTVATTTPATRCDSGTVTLQATASSGATLNWYAAATGGTALNSGATFITPSLTATTTYYVEAQFGTCSSIRTAVIATVNSTPTIATTTPASRCGSGNVTLQATASSGTIQWFATSTGGTAVFTGANFTTPTLTATTSYYVQVSQTGCISPRTEVVATINALPTITATTPAARCDAGTVTLQAAASSGTISWFASISGGTALATGTSFTTPSLTATTTYYVEAANGSCISSRTAVIATINATPTITSTTPGSICDSGTVSLSATTSAGTISWFANATGGAALATGLTFITPNLTATTSYYVQATIGTCTSGRTAVIATVNSTPALTGTTPAARCGTGTVTLSATANSGTIRWYGSATSGSILATGGTFVTPSLSTTTIYYVEVTQNNCTSARTPVEATITADPLITATTPASRCGNGTVTLLATASSGTINWFANATGGAALFTGGSFTTPNLTATTTYYTEATNGSCTSTRSAVVATINALPVLTGTTPASRCGNGSVTLQASASSGTISWYANATGGAALANGGSFTTPSLSATTTYYVEAANGTCSTTRTAVMATINPNATITATTPASRCGNGTVTLLATASSGTINWFANATGGTALFTGGSFTTPNLTATTTYYTEATNGNCTSARSAVVATINALPVLTGTTPASRCGNGTVILQASASSGAISWYANATGGTALANGGSFTTPSLSATTTYYVEAANGTCSTTRTAVMATINPTATITATTPASRCGNGTLTLLATASSGTISWFANATGGTALFTGASFTTPNLTATTTYYAEATNGSCTSTRSAVVATVILTEAPTGTANQTFCAGETVGQIVTNGTDIMWYDAATGGNLVPDATLIVTGTTYYASQTLNDGCESTTRLAITMTEGGCLGREVLVKFNMTVYPNPTKSFVIVSANQIVKRVELVNMLGQALFSKTFNETEVKIDLNHLSTGTYLVRVTSENQAITTYKILKE